MHRVGHPVTWRLLVYKEFETYQTYVPLHDRYGAYGHGMPTAVTHGRGG